MAADGDRKLSWAAISDTSLLGRQINMLGWNAPLYRIFCRLGACTFAARPTEAAPWDPRIGLSRQHGVVRWVHTTPE